MSVIDEVRGLLQDLVTPDLKELKMRMENLEREMSLRFDAINQRFDNLIEKLDLDKRLRVLEQERSEKRTTN